MRVSGSKGGFDNEKAFPFGSKRSAKQRNGCVRAVVKSSVRFWFLMKNLKVSA